MELDFESDLLSSYINRPVLLIFLKSTLSDGYVFRFPIGIREQSELVKLR